ncbi:MAG: DNA helicase-4 [Moritella sp.]
MPNYSFSALATLFGANCRAVSFLPDGAAFTSKHRQVYHYNWVTLDPKIKHYRGAFFDTLVLSWENQRIRLNGIAKADVTQLTEDLYYHALQAKQPELMQHYEQLSKVLEQGYVPHSQWLQLQEQLAPLSVWFEVLPRITKVPESLHLPLARLRFWQQSQAANLDKYNQAVINKQKQQHQTLFDTLESHPLTDKQRDACVVAEDANLVLAGAGCGKTSVMLGRCAYLLESGQALSQSILILAFAKDAAQEMQARLQTCLPQAKIRVKTFHALGLDIIAQVEGCKPKITKLATGDTAKQRFFKQTLTELLEEEDFNSSFSQFCYGYLTWQGKLCASKHEKEVDRLRAGKGGYKQLINLLCDLTMQYKNLFNSESERILNALPDDDFAVLSQAVVAPLADAYREYLQDNQAIDFDDMIVKAAEYVANGQFESPWLHILVDEFQDISQSRAALVRELQLQNNETKLFCVGDDWQAIYQFAGSDVAVTTRFTDHFGTAKTLPLDTTFRFNDQISAVATRFVMHNPAQIIKQLTTHVTANKPCVHVCYYQSSKERDTHAMLLEEKLSQIVAKPKLGSTVLILARFNFQLPNHKQQAVLCEQFGALDIQMMTVHAAKGQEADHVIVVAMQSGIHGFPCNKPRHPLTAMLQRDPESFPDAEERRLFYVALTRAKQQVYLLCDASNPSGFVEELVNEDYPVTVAKPTAAGKPIIQYKSMIATKPVVAAKPVTKSTIAAN